MNAQSWIALATAIIIVLTNLVVAIRFATRIEIELREAIRRIVQIEKHINRGKVVVFTTRRKSRKDAGMDDDEDDGDGLEE